jgi:hypothetical protein
MSDIITNVIIVTALVAIIVLAVELVLLVRRGKKKNPESLEEFAQKSGWQVEKLEKPTRRGFMFEGDLPNGKWFMETVYDTNAMDPQHHHHLTSWRTSAVRIPKGTVVFGPKPSTLVSVGSLYKSNPMRNAVLQQMLGEDISWTSNLEPFTIDPLYGEISKQYIGVYTSSNDMSAILDHDLMQALVALPSVLKPVFILKQDGLELLLPAVELSSKSDLQRFVEFGELVVKRWQK